MLQVTLLNEHRSDPILSLRVALSRNASSPAPLGNTRGQLTPAPAGAVQQRRHRRVTVVVVSQAPVQLAMDEKINPEAVSSS